jgi:hypothetical protein
MRLRGLGSFRIVALLAALAAVSSSASIALAQSDLERCRDSGDVSPRSRIDACNRAIDRVGTSPDVSLGMARGYLEDGDYPRARMIFGSVTTFDQNLAGYLGLAATCALQEDFACAEDALVDAEKNRPGEPRVKMIQMYVGLKKQKLPITRRAMVGVLYGPIEVIRSPGPR